MHLFITTLQYQEIRVTMEVNDRLIRAMHEISLARDLKKVMEIVRHAGHALTGADGTSFILRDGDLCYYADEEAIGPLWKGKRFPMAGCISGWAMLNQQPAVIEDIYIDPRTPVDAYRTTFVQSLAMVPIRTAAPIGAIGSYWAERHRATTDEVKLLQTLADSASIAMRNIELYEALEKKTAASERADKMKSAFLSAVSHELRTPLNAIIGYTHLLIDGIYGPVGENQQMPLEGVQRNAAEILRLIDTILDLAQIESGGIALRTEPVDLAPLLRDLILELRPLMDQKSVFLRLVVAADLLPIESDPVKIRQILIHLLTNTVRFTENGEVDVAARVLSEQGGTEITIRDNGIGTPEAARTKTFEPSHRMGESDTRELGGVGLELIVVKQLLGQLQGSLRVEGEPGRGSTFIIALPSRLEKEKEG